MRKYKKKNNPNIVITFGKNAAFANVFSRGKEKIFIGIRSYDWLYQYTYGFFLEKYMYKKADKVISVSRLIKEDAEKIFNIDKNKSYYLYNPYDIKYINDRSEEEITEVDIDNSKKNIVAVGRLENQKGFYHLVKAISLLDNNIKEKLSLYILGNGSKKIELQNMINKLNLNNNIFLIGGQDNPYKFMKRADLFVMSSITEGFPNVLVEAMSLGVPVLCSDCKSGPREILTNTDLSIETTDIEFGDYGILVNSMTDSRNYNVNYIEECDKIFAAAIERTIDDSNLLEKYGKEAKKRAADFSYKVFEKNLCRILEGE